MILVYMNGDMFYCFLVVNLFLKNEYSILLGNRLLYINYYCNNINMHFCSSK